MREKKYSRERVRKKRRKGKRERELEERETEKWIRMERGNLCCNMILLFIHDISYYVTLQFPAADIAAKR